MFIAPGLFFNPSKVCGQVYADTLKITIPQAEQIFMQSNFSLLADQYNIDINRALVQQAKVWDNPVLSSATNFYDGKFFRHSLVNGQQYGQIYLQVQQLIHTAGKIKKQTQLALDNVLGSESQFAELLRNLKYALVTGLNNLAALQNTALIYKKELRIMQSLVKGMDEMFKLGDISQKDNIRIKALLFSIQTEYNQNLQQQIELVKNLSLLLALKANTWIESDAKKTFTSEEIAHIVIRDIQDSALTQRPDLAYAKNQINYLQHNIAFQKAQATPDITIGLDYDQNSSYAKNIVGLGVSLPIPLFNKNKGNIRAAEYSYKQSGVLVQQLQSEISNEVANAYQKLLTTSSLFNDMSQQLGENYETLIQNMTESYRQRHISLVEFIDFFESYKDNRVKLCQQVANQRNAAAELNFSTNQNTIQL